MARTSVGRGFQPDRHDCLVKKTPQNDSLIVATHNNEAFSQRNACLNNTHQLRGHLGGQQISL